MAMLFFRISCLCCAALGTKDFVKLKVVLVKWSFESCTLKNIQLLILPLYTSIAPYFFTLKFCRCLELKSYSRAGTNSVMMDQLHGLRVNYYWSVKVKNSPY